MSDGAPAFCQPAGIDPISRRYEFMWSRFGCHFISSSPKNKVRSLRFWRSALLGFSSDRASPRHNHHPCAERERERERREEKRREIEGNIAMTREKRVAPSRAPTASSAAPAQLASSAIVREPTQPWRKVRFFRRRRNATKLLCVRLVPRQPSVCDI
jgi:hypothetical protein